MTTSTTTAPAEPRDDEQPPSRSEADERGPRRVRSARGRIVVWVLVLVLGALAVVTFGTWRLLVGATDDRMNTALRSEIAEFTALTANGRDPGTGEPFGTVDQVLQTAITYNLARPNEKFLGYRDGVFRYQSRQQAPVLLSSDPAFAALVGTVPAPVSGAYASAAGEVRYLAVPVTLQNDPARGVLVAAYFADQERRAANEAALLFMATGAGAALLVAGVAWLVAGRILRPVRDVAHTARSITEADLSARIPDGGGSGRRDEIGELVDTVNAMLDRVEDGTRAQRRFVDDAGHELRTPITIVRGHLEVVDPSDADDVREALGLVDDELERMNRLVSDLLVLAKAGQPEFVRREPTDVAVLLEETLRKARALGDREWALLEPGPLEADLDAQRVTQALLVLADNAVGHTGPSDQVVLAAAADEHELRLRVSDTGVGVPVADRRRIFERFARGASPRRSDGAGLGLAIAAAIAGAHGGRVEVADGVGTGLPGQSGPGAAFTLVLPRYRKGAHPMTPTAILPAPGAARR